MSKRIRPNQIKQLEFICVEDAVKQISNDEAREIEEAEYYDLCVVPPELAVLTDDDDEDDNPQKFEVIIPKSDITINEDHENTPDWSLLPEEVYFRFKEAKWSKKAPSYTNINSNDCLEKEANFMKSQLSNLAPHDLFEKMLSDDVIEHISNQSVLYARQKGDLNFHVDTKEMKIFIAILVFTGYHWLPQERMYWSRDEDIGIPFVYKNMSRDRYLTIKRFLHLNDNRKIEDSDDRMYKIRPLMDLLMKNFGQWGYIHNVFSVDESMVKYFGRHYAKQFIKGKPIRLGYKLWMLCSSDGYCYLFDVYCGKDSEKPRLKNMPLGAKVVIDLLKQVPNPTKHTVFIDNYFTTHSLMVYLRKNGIRATGTVRDNRIEKCPIMSSKDMKKERRGLFDFCFDTENEILCVKWNDNSVCSILTNYDLIEPLQVVKRWSKDAGKQIDIPQPFVFKSYNNGMGGVDIHDQCRSLYRIGIKGKKWWWVLFTSMIDMCVTNAWKLHQMTAEKKIDQLLFRRKIVQHFLGNASAKKPNPKRSINVNVCHIPQKLKKQIRCVVCHKKARWSCKICVKTLCLERDCFESYHIKLKSNSS